MPNQTTNQQTQNLLNIQHKSTLRKHKNTKAPPTNIKPNFKHNKHKQNETNWQKQNKQIKITQSNGKSSNTTYNKPTKHKVIKYNQIKPILKTESRSIPTTNQKVQTQTINTNSNRTSSLITNQENQPYKPIKNPKQKLTNYNAKTKTDSYNPNQVENKDKVPTPKPRITPKYPNTRTNLIELPRKPK